MGICIVFIASEVSLSDCKNGILVDDPLIGQEFEKAA